MASGAGKVSTVRLLLSLGADVTHRNALHRTAQDLAKDPATAEIFTGTAAPSQASCVSVFVLTTDQPPHDEQRASTSRPPTTEAHTRHCVTAAISLFYQRCLFNVNTKKGGVQT
jgi:hypothetical protein